MHRSTKLTLRQLHDQHMDSWGTCPDGPDCPFCVADRQADEREHGDYSSDSQWSEEDRDNRAADCRERAIDMNRSME